MLRWTAVLLLWVGFANPCLAKPSSALLYVLGNARSWIRELRSKDKWILHLGQKGGTLDPETHEETSIFSFAPGQIVWYGDDSKIGKLPLYIGFEPRFYIPKLEDINPTDWDDNWIYSAKQTLRLKYVASPVLTLSLKNSLSYHAYRTGGYLGQYGYRAYQIFTNRLRLAAEVQIIPERLAFYFPITFRSGRYADYRSGAKFNGRTRHSLWITPDLTYTFKNGNYISLVYESDTFVDSTLSEFYFTESLASFSATLYVGISL